MSRPRVLIVDDETFFITLLSDILKADYHTITAKNGTQALKQAACTPPPDLILLDIVMQEIDGFEVCKALQADPETRDIPIIFLTAMSDIDDETHGLESGAVDFITKPISPPILKARVATQLALSAARQELSRQNEILEQKIQQRTVTLRLTQTAVDRSSDEAFWLRPDGSFAYVNDKACKELGYSREAFEQLTIADIISDFSPELWEKHWQRLRDDKECSLVLYCINSEGERYPVEASISYVEFDGQEFNFIFARDISKRREAERQLRQYQEQLQYLAYAISMAEERQRRHIAADLHDGPVQHLALARIRLGALREQLAKRDEVPCELLEEISGLITTTVREARSLMVELSPPVLHELGLEAAVEWLAERINEEQEIICNVEIDPNPKPLEEKLKVVLFQAVRELLLNVKKHAHAKHVKVYVEKEGAQIRLIVQDDGVGFDATNIGALLSTYGGFGLFALRERLQLLSGQMEIESGSHGTRIELIAPLIENDATEQAGEDENQSIDR